MSSEKSEPHDLYKQANGDKAEYKRLLIEHGHLILDPKCHECSQRKRSRIHHDANIKGAHHFTPMLTSEDAALHMAYLEMDAEGAQVYWEQARGNPESFEALIRHAVSHEFKVLGGEESASAFARGAKGGYACEITDKKTGQKTTGMMCIRSHPGERLPRCEFCRTRKGDNLCDYPTGKPCEKCSGTGRRGLHVCHDCSGTGKGTCSRAFCRSCGYVKSKDEGYCPDHRERAGGGKPHLQVVAMKTRNEAEEIARLELRKLRDGARFPGACVMCGAFLDRGCACWFSVAKRRLVCEDCVATMKRSSE